METIILPVSLGKRAVALGQESESRQPACLYCRNLSVKEIAPSCLSFFSPVLEFSTSSTYVVSLLGMLPLCRGGLQFEMSHFNLREGIRDPI